MSANAVNYKHDTEKQLQFARHNFDNLQNLIRFSDTKAAALVTLTIFLGATLVQVAKDAISLLHWHPHSLGTLSAVLVAALAGFSLCFAWLLLKVQEIIKPRGASHYQQAVTGHELMWQDHVIQHETNAAYFSAVQAAPGDVLLRNLTDQIFELSHISKAKIDAFHKARRVFWLVFLFWALTIICGILLLRWR